MAAHTDIDVVDPKTVNPDLGDEADFRALVTSLRAYGMGVILDIVPNHMAASSTENPYWHELLMYGRCAPHAHWFDVDWRLTDPEMWGRVLVPVLAEPLSRVLAKDQLCVAWNEGRLTVRYFDHLFPLDPATVPVVFRFGLEQLDCDHPALGDVRVVLKKLGTLPRRVTRLRSQVELPMEEIQSWLSQLAQIVAPSPQVQQWTEQTAARFGQGDDGHIRLRKLLKAQNYRLVYWRRAATAINYRDSSTSTISFPSAKRTPACSRRRTSRLVVGYTKGWWTGSASTIWTACATHGTTCNDCASWSPRTSLRVVLV